MAVQATMRALANGDLRRIVPGHEPRIYRQGHIVEIQDLLLETFDREGKRNARTGLPLGYKCLLK